VLLKTLFSNLITNATKYQPKNKEGHIPIIKIWAKESDQSTEVYISDNGIGIKKDYIPKLFSPFKRFHSNDEYKGTGLGMSICKRVMENHNGQIEVFQTSESGTTFKLTFQYTQHPDQNLK